MNKLQTMLVLPLFLFVFGCENEASPKAESQTPLEKLLSAPGGLSHSDYADFQQLAPPKLLFSCEQEIVIDKAENCFKDKDAGLVSEDTYCGHLGEDVTKYVETTYVGYIAQMGPLMTYNKMLQDAKDKCDSNKSKFQLLEGAY